MRCKGSLPGVHFRRSQLRDVPQLARLLQLADVVSKGIPSSGVFCVNSASEFASLIQTSYLCVTAVRDTSATTTDATDANGDPTEETVIGFIALSDESPVNSEITTALKNSTRNGTLEEELAMVQTMVFAEETFGTVEGASLGNSLWLRMLIAPPSSAFRALISPRIGRSANKRAAAAGVLSKSFESKEMVMNLFRVSLGTLSAIEHIFIAPGSDFPILEEIPGLAPLSTKAAAARPLDAISTSNASIGALLHVSRAMVIPPLTIRQGRVEDYDDIVELLVAGGPGVITELPQSFYLEEILQYQDQHNKVVVAEDSHTHEVVGVACLRHLTSQEQQQTVRLYNTDIFERLKRVSSDASGSDAHYDTSLSCTFSIYFLYFNPSFDHSAYQLLPFLFYEFPTCDYATLQLSHTLPLPEPMILERFQYMPLRRYQLHDSRGELIATPNALWICPRVSLTVDQGVQARVELITDPQNAVLLNKVQTQYLGNRNISSSVSAGTGGKPMGTGVHAAGSQHHRRDGAGGSPSGLPGCSLELLALLRQDLDTWNAAVSSGEHSEAGSAMSKRVMFALTWSAQSGGGSAGVLSSTRVVGVISVQSLSVEEMYALRANYDLDHFLFFNAQGGFNYEATDISLSAQEGPLRYRSSELPGVLVRFVHVRPVFRQHLKFFLREVLRQTQAEVLLTLTSTDAALCQTAIAAFTFAPPRRVVEVSTTSKKEESDSPTSIFDNIADFPDVNDVTSTLHQQNVTTSAANGSMNQKSLALSSLFFTTRRFLGDERVRVHERILIVGASATALCVLYELLSVPYLDYLNITVVSTDSMPLHPNQCFKRQWQADGMELLEREYMRLCLGDGLANPSALSIGVNTIRFVQGTLVDIDTTMKFIHLENRVYEPYDQLLLATGRQYIVPPSIRSLQQQEGGGTRGGILALSGDIAEDRLRQALSEASQSMSGTITNVVVYGSGLDAVATLSTMVAMGFPAQRLVLCRPNTEQLPFADVVCDQATMALFRALGVTVLDGYGVSRLEFDDETLTSVLLSSLSYERKAGDAVELPCALIVCLEEKEINRSILTALAKRSIVFDGRVIVGSAYETSQPNVLAAGPVAMFTRRYGATEAFESFNPRDVGRDVARVLLARVGVKEFQSRIATANDPHEGSTHVASTGGGSGDVETTSQKSAMESCSEMTRSVSSTSFQSTQVQKNEGPTLPSYTSPVSRRVCLPCGYQYVSTVRGSAAFEVKECTPVQFSSVDMLSVPLDEVHQSAGMSVEKSEGAPVCREMMTLYVHTHHLTIDGVVYLGNGSPEAHNYRSLVGLPESLFHIQYRHREAIQKRQTGDGLVVSSGAGAMGGSGAAAVPHGVLTVPPRNQQFDLVSYLRLPTLKPLLTDRFARFFLKLQHDMQTVEEVIAVHERALSAHRGKGTLSPAAVAAHVSELTSAKAFRYKVQLELIKYLHETKDTRPQDMYLPSIQKQMEERSCGVGRKG